MHLSYNNDDIFVSTGGRAFDASGEVLLFIHGSGQSHLTFLQQGRFFANRDWQSVKPRHASAWAFWRHAANNYIRYV